MVIMQYLESLSKKNSKGQNFGVVVHKFDPDVGPVLISNDSALGEDDVGKLIIKGTSILMSSAEYDLNHSRIFRGLIPVNSEFFAYCFDLMLIDDVNHANTIVPFLIFVVFPKNLIKLVGSSLLNLEEFLYSFSSSILWLSQFKEDFGKALRKQLVHFYLGSFNSFK